MEHLRIKFTYFSLHAISSAFARPDAMWRSVIFGTTLIAIALSVFSYISYAWAEHTAPAVLTKPTQAPITREDISMVIATYRAKEKSFSELVQKAPLAPALESDAGKDTGEVSFSPALESGDEEIAQ